MPLPYGMPPQGMPPSPMGMAGAPNPRNAIAQAIMGQRQMGGNMGVGMRSPMPIGMGRPPPGPPMPGGMPGAGMTPPPGPPGANVGMNAFNTQMANMAPPPGMPPTAPGAPMPLQPPAPGAAPPGGMSQMFNQQGSLPPLY